MTGWQRARACNGGGCVELARHGGRVEIRDSKRPAEVAWFSEEDWAAFVEGVKRGEFDGPKPPRLYDLDEVLREAGIDPDDPDLNR